MLTVQDRCWAASTRVPLAAMQLTGKQKHYLRGLAHALNPVVQVGKSGLTEPVLGQIDRALLSHELIKVKLGKECPTELDGCAEGIEAFESQLAPQRAAVVQTIGHVLVVYRPHPETPRISLPRASRHRSQR